MMSNGKMTNKSSFDSDKFRFIYVVRKIKTKFLKRLTWVIVMRFPSSLSLPTGIYINTTQYFHYKCVILQNLKA